MDESNWKRAVAWTGGLFIAVNVVLTLVAWLVRLPDLPHTHATTDRLGLGTVLWGSGSIISPPFVFMVAVALLLWGVVSTRRWLSSCSAGLLVVGVAVMGVDELTGDGGLRNKPELYSQSKWELTLVLGWAFVVVAAAVVACGIGLLQRTRPVKIAHLRWPRRTVR